MPGRFTKKIWASKRLPPLPFVMRTCNEDGASVVCDTAAKCVKRCWSSGKMNCRNGKNFDDACKWERTQGSAKALHSLDAFLIDVPHCSTCNHANIHDYRASPEMGLPQVTICHHEPVRALISPHHVQIPSSFISGACRI